MWRSKKSILIVLLAALLLVGGATGIVLAQTENGDESQPKTLLDRVAEILNIDQQELKDAFAQAQSEMRDEALDNYLQKLVDAGKITQEEAAQYKAWLQERPDMEPFRQQLKEWEQTKPGIPPELKEWQEARPDDTPLPGLFKRFGGHGFRGGMKQRGGHFFWGK